MKTFFSFVAVCLVIISCNSKNKKSDTPEMPIIENRGDSLLLTDSTWGWLEAGHNFEDLKKMYGEADVKDERICGAECIDSVDVTLVYPGSSREFIVYWNDSAYHKQIAFIRCYTAGAPYYTADSIMMGSTLKDLLQKNGKPISFLGFGWDYGGGITSLNHGALENSSIHFTLDITENTSGDNAVYGDKELNSDMPAVKRLVDKIRVSELFLSFN